MSRSFTLCGLAACLSLSACVGQEAQLRDQVPQYGNSWFQNGKATIAVRKHVKPVTGRAKNVIVFVADGMGPGTATAARILAGQQKGLAGEETFLSFETNDFPYTAIIKTYNTDAQTPDSAGTAVTWNTGIKTRKGVLGVDESVLRGNCASAKGKNVMTLAEMAEELGMSTGIVTTARLTHATPAAVYAHSPERDWEDNSLLPAEAVEEGCTDIARQLIEFPFGDGIDVALGGGRRHFLPNTSSDHEDPESKGARTDNRNLIQEWLEKNPNGTFVWNKEQFEKSDAARTNKLFGLFNASHMQYEHDRNRDKGGEPALQEMTAKAIDILSRNTSGFYLMVEAGRIDHGHHDGNAYRALTDAVEFSNAVATAVEKTEINDTLIIVTSDHGHTFSLAGNARRGNPILGMAQAVDLDGRPTGDLVLAEDGKPYTVINYLNGPGALNGSRADLTAANTQHPDFVQQSIFPMDSETHSGIDVIAYARGPMAYLLGGVLEQNVLFHLIDEAMQLTPRLDKHRRHEL